MKIICDICHREILINEQDYTPGEEISVECLHCGNIIPVIIPEDTSKKAKEDEKVRVIRKRMEPLTESEESQLTIHSESGVHLDIETSKNGDNEKPRLKSTNKKRISDRENKSGKSDKLGKSDNSLNIETTEGSTSPNSTKHSVRSTKKKPSSSTSQTNPPSSTTKPTPPSYKGRSRDKQIKSPDSSVEKNYSTFTIGGCLMVIIGVVVVFLIIWMFRSCGGDTDKEITSEGSSEKISDTSPVMEETYVRDYVEDTIRIDSAEVNAEYDYNEDEYTEEPENNESLHPLGFKRGYNSFNANMIHTDGRRFPFDLSFNFDPDTHPSISNAVYFNPSAGTKVKLRVDEFNENFIRFIGETGGKDFILQFSGTDPYKGDAWWGDFHQDVEMSLK